MRAQVDSRTETMSVEAVTCRSLGHSMVMIPTPVVERLEHKRRGQRLLKLKCSRGCSRWRTILLDLTTHEVLGDTGGYQDPKSYVVQERGTGRLPRAVARGAFFRVVGDR